MIEHMSYRDLDPEHRQRIAETARLKLLTSVSPTATPEQLKELESRLDHLDMWAKGELT